MLINILSSPTPLPKKMTTTAMPSYTSENCIALHKHASDMVKGIEDKVTINDDEFKTKIKELLFSVCWMLKIWSKSLSSKTYTTLFRIYCDLCRHVSLPSYTPTNTTDKEERDKASTSYVVILFDIKEICVNITLHNLLPVPKSIKNDAELYNHSIHHRDNMMTVSRWVSGFDHGLTSDEYARTIKLYLDQKHKKKVIR